MKKNIKYILNSEEALEIDRISISKYKIPSIILMENAGLRTAIWIDQILNGNKKRKIVVIAGSGNNGGDGYVVARALINYGYNVEIILMNKQEAIKGDAKINLDILHNLNLVIKNYNETISLDSYDFIIDAIFGVGLSREISKGKYYNIIEKIGKTQAIKLSIDIPSGIDGSTGNIMGIALKSDYTATYGYLKYGHLFKKDLCGEIKVFDISFPKNTIFDLNKKTGIYIDKEFIKPLLPIRRFDSHKYQNGNLLLIGGSLGKIGAILMSAKAALRTGVGVATLLTQEKVLHGTSTVIELMSMPYKELSDIKNYLNKKTAIAIGPGIKLEEETSIILKYLLKNSNIPMVIDADGLNIIKNSIDFFTNIDKEIIITPHLKEFSRLTNLSIKEIVEDRVNILSHWAKKWKITIILKGANSIIASKNGDIYINSTGNSGMATAGSGDVLTGIIATFLSQGLSGIDATILGVFIHGLSGDIAIKELGKRSLIATDLISYLPLAFKEIGF